MSLNPIITVIYFLSLGIWLVFVIISLRAAFYARSLSKKMGPVTVIFLVISGILILVSVYFLINLENNTTANTAKSRSVQY